MQGQRRPEVSEVGDYCMSGSMFVGAAAQKIRLLRVWASFNRWQYLFLMANAVAQKYVL